MSSLERVYSERFNSVLKPLAARLETYLQTLFEGQPRIDRINARAKSIASFLSKSQALVDGKPKYVEPLAQIQDQVGARVTTFYLSDVKRATEVVLKYLRAIEERELVPETPWSFGYFGRHFVLLMPTDVIDAADDPKMVPNFFELQIKTLFQHAWSEANHDLGYKPGSDPLPSDIVRRLAFTSAQAWGADHIFAELFGGRAKLDGDVAASPRV